MTSSSEKRYHGSRVREAAASILQDERGSVIVYVSVIIAVLIGLVGMAIDFSRYYDSHSEAQSAADASALAAASQLDGLDSAIDRATNAAMTTPLVSNSQTFATSADAGGTVVITNIRFLTDLPANDTDPITAGFETTDPLAARFVEVTTEPLLHNNLFVMAVGVANSTTLSATAVAGLNTVICNITPLMICNPAEAPPPDGLGVGAPFNPDAWHGRQIVAKRHSGSDTGSGAWKPGNFGLLEGPNNEIGAKDIAEMLASAAPPVQCYDANVDLSTGAKESLRNAFNTRFDQYDVPYFGNGHTNPLYRPAENVTKGVIWNGSGGALCNSSEDPGLHDAAGFGRDSNIADSDQPRFGNGEWDCAGYWSINHPGVLAPVGCDVPALTTLSRHEIYRYEIDNIIIPDNTPIGGEDGNPQCYAGDTSDIGKGPDRRVLYLAVINCEEHNIQGREEDVPTVAFLKTFLTEPVGDESSPGATDSDIYLEVVGNIGALVAPGAVHDIIQLYR